MYFEATPRRGSCVFCGRAPTVGNPLTREHVPPAWASKLIREKVVGATSKKDKPFTAEYRGEIHMTKEIGERVRDVCEDCNSGWLARELEDIARPILTPLILAQ